MSFLLGLPIFRGYVKFLGCTNQSPHSQKGHKRLPISSHNDPVWLEYFDTAPPPCDGNRRSET